MIHLTGGGRTIFLIVMRFNWGRQGKDLAQFQQFILIVITKKDTNWKRYKRRYYYSSLCSRICEILLYFFNLKSSWSSCGARLHSHFPTTRWEAWFHGELQCMPLGVSADNAAFRQPTQTCPTSKGACSRSKLDIP